jgi:hypothetical protein
MANYYYATARVYITPGAIDGQINNTDLQPIVKNNPVDCYNGWKVWYVIDVYRSTESDFTKWQASTSKGTLLSGTLKKATINLNTSDSNIYAGNGGQFQNVQSHLEISVTRDTTTGGGTVSCTPTISITQNDANSGIDQPVTNIQWLNTGGVVPAIAFTAKVPVPTFPSDTIDAWRKTQYGTNRVIFPIVERFWDQCQNKWLVMIYGSHSGIDTLWYFDQYGQNPTSPISTGVTITSANQKDMNAKQWLALNQAKAGLTCKGDGATSTDPGNPEVNVAPPTDYLRWNPPPHAESRSVPYSIRNAKTFLNASGNPLDAYNVELAANFYTKSNNIVSDSKGYSYLERGRIFQDKNSAAVLNSAATSKPADSATAKQWGFRFMYNPTTISYNTSANNSIDWTLGSKDSAALLSGNQQVTLQIYLNRIVDLGYLSQGKSSGAAAYGRDLSQDEIKGILSRGTEYDLEFLYRCLTGDPITNNPLLNSNFKDTGSADIGYITGVPLWMYLNDNMRYYGSVASLGVNHVIFNTEMVPMLSVVDISFSRYPAQFGNSSDTVKGIYTSTSGANTQKSASGPNGTGG